MERDFGKELDTLHNELHQLSDQVMALTNKLNIREKADTLPTDNVPPTEDAPYPNGIHPMRHMHPDPRLRELMEELCRSTDEKHLLGQITYLGVFASGGRQSNWISNQIDVQELLRLIENRTAEKVLQCIGSNDRLNILLAILRKPMTVAQLVEECGYNSTGQVYHHMKPLIAADLIREDENERGSYVIQPHRVQGILMLLAGISDMLDPKYSQGTWSPTGADDSSV